MNRLRVAPGDGRLLRRGRFIIFSLEADDDLQQLRPSPGGEIFKSLAALIVARDFALPSLAAIDLQDNRLFIFGDVGIQVDGDFVSGADSATWIERRFAPGATVVSTGMHHSEADTDLVEGCVPASAFGLNMALIQNGRGEPAGGPEVVPSGTVDGAASLARARSAGAPQPSEAAEVFDADDTEDLDLVVDTPQATAPTRSARLVCSNGYSALVSRGLIVGRFPSKHGVPDGYDTLKVAGAEVSRVHLRFVLEGDVLHVRDENTSNGSTLISSQRAIRPVPSGADQLALEPGDAIEFGDQTIVFHDWETVNAR